MKYHGDHNPYNVKALWEVRLRPDIVEKIKSAAQNYNTTMSWVVRYCAFKLFRRKKINIARLHQIGEFLREKNQPKPIAAKKLHRLRVCLYGDDERIFLELKYRFGLTTTMLIRIALKMYLNTLQHRQISRSDFFYYGLKFFSETKNVYSNKLLVPQVDFHFKTFFKNSDYWGIPPGPPPTFLLV